ncbi:MAG: hypothetical protein MI867_11935 [Pseudomonadales bacterium]|nr:hypothetical protein [Pseudomonadales bacterium]
MYRVLVVGAGAVGQVYGHFMQRGGASVSFFVKDKYKEECEKGFTLYRSRRRGLGPGEHYQADAVYTDYKEVAEQHFDHVWLAMSSNDLHGDWLADLKAAIGDTTVVMLQPDLEDRDYVLKYFPDSQLVYGIINFISYQTPLPDLPSHHSDADKEGVAYLMLPMMSAEFSGNHERLPEVMEALAAGRFPVKAQQNVPRIYADRSAWMIPLVAMLELENWSIKRLMSSGSLELAVEGAKQALAIVAAKFHRPLNWTERGFSLLLVKVLLPLVRFLSPMDAESFVKFQFKKTAPQTRFMLDHFIYQGEQLGMNVTALKSLREKLPDTQNMKAA